MRDVTIRLRGASRAVGDIPARSSKSAKVNPTGESSVDIDYTDAASRRKTLGADCYLESGGYDRVTVQVTPQNTVLVNRETKVTPFF